MHWKTKRDALDINFCKQDKEKRNLRINKLLRTGKFTDWDKDFLTSLLNRNTLSEKQSSVLNRINKQYEMHQQDIKNFISAQRNCNAYKRYSVQYRL